MELLGGTGLDPSKMMPLADLCYPFHGPGEIDVSLIIIYVPIKIISLSKTSYFFCTWESNFHTHTHTKPSILHIEPV